MQYTIHWYNWYSTLLFNSYNDINLYIPQAPLKQHIWQAFAELCHAGQLTVLDPVRQTWPTATKSQDMPVLQGPMMNLLFWRCRTYWTYNLVHFRFNRYHTDNSKIWSEMIWYIYIHRYVHYNVIYFFSGLDCYNMIDPKEEEGECQDRLYFMVIVGENSKVRFWWLQGYVVLEIIQFLFYFVWTLRPGLPF